MPWKDTCPMEERMKFVSDWLRNEWSVSELCRKHGVSRKTGYKWLERYEQGGLDGLKDLSHAARVHPNQTPGATEEALIGFRERHPQWGPRKLIQRLGELKPEVEWPAASTAGAILRRHGLVKRSRRKLKAPLFDRVNQSIQRPNDVWGADFKGWFRTRDGVPVDPLTISDLSSRYLIECQALSSTCGEPVRRCFERVFRRYGLPWAIRTDNGPPFAGVGLGGLTRLSVWWIRLGILPERIRPGHPEENGRHERMHRTLKEATARPPRQDRRTQPVAFNAFRREFNEERPHEALGMVAPARRYCESVRPDNQAPPEMEYGVDVVVRRVRPNGVIKWGGGFVYLSEALVGKRVGFTPVDEDQWTIHFGPVPLGTYNAVDGKIHRFERIKL